MDLYRDKILDHYKHPRNYGHLHHVDARHTEYNRVCGDTVSVEIQYYKKNNQLYIQDISFYGEGCAISQASASMLTEKVKGKSIEYVIKLQWKDIKTLLDTQLTPTRIKCATLPLVAIHNALAKRVKNST